MASYPLNIGLEAFELSLERERFSRAGFTTSFGRVAEHIYRALLFQSPEEWKLSLLVQRRWRGRRDEEAVFSRRKIEIEKFFMLPSLPLIQHNVGQRWREYNARNHYIPRVQQKRFDILHFTGQVPWGLRPLAPAEIYAAMDFYWARVHPSAFRPDLAKLQARLDSLWPICISDFTAAEAVQFLGIAPERARSIPLAVDHSIYRQEPAEDDDAMRKHYNLPVRYILYVDNFQPRKNVSTLARAMERLGLTS